MTLRGYNIPIHDIEEVKELLKEGEYITDVSIQTERGLMLSFNVREAGPDEYGIWKENK